MPKSTHSTPTTRSEFALLYRDHLPAMVRFMRRRLGEAEAEDAAADVFLRAYRSGIAADAWRVSPAPWLYGIASNVISERRRSERRRLRALARIAANVSQADPAIVSGDGWRLDASLLSALRRLKTKDRDALLLVVWGELSYDQAAEALAIPVGTLRSRIARARTALRGDLDCEDPKSEPTLLRGEAHV